MSNALCVCMCVCAMIEMSCVNERLAVGNSCMYSKISLL